MDISNLYYGDDFGWFEEDELCREERKAEDKAWMQQQLQEAHAEFLDSPNCFD
jgi:hypothetical protein